MDISIIESNDGAAAFMLKGLREEGYLADWFGDCREGFHAVHEKKYSLLIVGSCRAELDATRLCARLRQSGVRTPIIIVSERDSTVDRVRGLDAGADDFLGKPFALEELLARIRAVRRRHAPEPAAPFSVGDLELDPLSHRVTRGGRAIDLTPREYALLKFLIQRPGRVLSRSVLIDQVWDRQFDVKSNVVDVYINYLRNKIDHAGKQPLIHTVRGCGYMLSERGGRVN